MDSAPKEQEQLYTALLDCNRHIPEENRFIVPFICVSAIPYGLLYKQNLESNPTVSDTFTALFNRTQTKEISVTLIKFALEVAGCPSEKIEQVQNAGICETGIHTLYNDEVRQGLQFHQLLVDIVNDLPADLRRQLINMSSGYLSSNPIHTECLHVHFLRLIQQNVIGRKDVSKLHKFIVSIRRQDILDRIDKYCREVGLPFLPRTYTQHPQALMTPEQLTGELHPAPEQESRREPMGSLAFPQVHTTQLHLVEMDKPTELKEKQLVDRDEPADPELKNGNGPNELEFRNGDEPTEPNPKQLIDGDEPTELQLRHGSELTESELRHGSEPTELELRHGSEPNESECRHGSEPTELEFRPANEPYERLDDTTGPPKGCNACKGYIIKRKRCITVTFALTVLALCCFTVFLVFEFYPSTNGQVFFEEGDVVLVSNNGFDPFLYKAVNFTRNGSSTQTSDTSNIKFYMQQCSKLVPNQRPILTNVTLIPSINEDRRHPVYQGYLVSGSKVLFDMNITAHTVLTNCSAAIHIFRDYDSYFAFLYYGTDGSNAEKICLLFSNMFNQRTPYTFTVVETSYYFAALSAPTGSDGVDNIFFQTSGTQMYYTTGNLSPSCNIVRGTNSSCSVPLNTVNQSVQLSIGKLQCFLAVLLAESASTGSDNKLHAYLSYSSSTAHNPIHNIAKLLTLLLPVFSLLLTIVIALVYCFVRYVHSRSATPTYVRIDSRPNALHLCT